jgi:hypothetical protein
VEVLEKLVEKTAAVVPKQGHWKVLHVGLARGGWSAEAHELAQQTAGLEGENWVANPAVLVDLVQVDTDFAMWI